MADYHKVGLITMADHHVLLCRKRGLGPLILPGGQLEAGESAEECLRRELTEELGDVTVEKLTYLGTYQDRAATADPNEVKTVEIQLYLGELCGQPVASSEIAELVWFGLESDWKDLSPILVRKIFPDLRERGIIPW